MLKEKVKVLSRKVITPSVWQGTIAEFLMKKAKTVIAERHTLIKKVKKQIRERLP